MFRDLQRAGMATVVIGKTHWYAGTKFKEQFSSKKEYFTALGIDTFHKYDTDDTWAELRHTRVAYLGKISFLDDLLARLINAIKNRGTWDRTILVFTADHGVDHR